MLNGTETLGNSSAPQAADATAPPKPRREPPKRKMKTAKKLTLSTISFPYRDLDLGVSVALAILGAGGVPLTSEQLAGVMNLQAGSGNFALKVMTARAFGLVNNAGGKYELTDTGFAIVDKNDARQRAARAAAFMNVPLYKRTYEEFRGRQLPPRPHGLEQAFIKFGVSPKSVQAARLAFEKSAAQAGYFSAGSDRLIEPIIPGGAAPPPSRPPTSGDDGNGNGEPPRAFVEVGSPPPDNLNPFIRGLLETLPEPYTNWAVEGRAKWLQAAANIFDLIYKGTGDIQITSKVVPEEKK